MNIVITSEHRFDRLPDGTIWTSGAHAYTFWKRYLSVFDEAKVLARIRDVDSVPGDWLRADGQKVNFIQVPYYLGPWQYLKNAFRIHRAIRLAVKNEDAVIMRAGTSQIAGCLAPILNRQKRPYGLEVVGDPYDVYAPGAVRHWLRPFFRYWFTRQLRQQCMRASGVSYVTKTSLQSRYPCAGYSEGTSDVEISDDAIVSAPGVFTTHYSSVELQEDDCIPSGRSNLENGFEFRLVTVGTLAQMYKGVDVLIDAVAICVKSGMNLILVVIGDGKHRRELEAQAIQRGLKDRVRFLGQLPAGQSIRQQLDLSHLFVMPSRCEGLPRAMIEAMARGLPCIGSSVGGIPELLQPEAMVPPSNAVALAAKIQEVLSSRSRMEAMSHRNLGIAQEYRAEVLEKRRQKFLESLRSVTENWSASISEVSSHQYAAVLPRRANL